jgi:hypothetical protein
MFHEMRRDAQALKENAEELMRLSSEKVPGFIGQGISYRGEALAMMGQVQEGIVEMREGMVARLSGIRCHIPEILRSVAEAYGRADQPEEGLITLTDAQAFLEETDERHWEAELYRVRAELLLMQGSDAEAEASFHQAIGVARRPVPVLSFKGTVMNVVL